MKFKTILILTLLFSLGCGSPESPTDKYGKKPEEVLLQTYLFISNGEIEKAKSHFSESFIKQFITDKNKTFEQYCEEASKWDASWLKSKLKGNDYNKNIWRVKIIPDKGLGAKNPPGVVHDLHLIDGVWKIVFWGDYPKT